MSPNTCRSPEDSKRVKIQSGQIYPKPSPDRSDRRTISNGVNNTQIQSHMREKETVKVLVKVVMWARFNGPTN